MKESIIHEEQRYTLFPIVHNDIWNLYKKQLSMFWISSEIDFSEDYNDWLKLTDNEKHFIKNVLAFFASADGLVSINIMNNFSKDVLILEAQYCYNFQCTIEGIHNEVYSLLIDNLIKDKDEKNFLFNSIKNISSVNKKANWAFYYNDSNVLSFPYRLMGYIIIEGLFFSASFCAIYWIKQRNILKGLTKSNEFIARDERLHTEFGIMIYKKLDNKIPEEKVHEMFEQAIDMECEFIEDAIPVKLIGMNSDDMKLYIKYVANMLLIELGYKPIFKDAKNNFGFMNLIGLEGRSNFFDERTSQYQMNTNSHNNLVMVEDF